MSFLIPFFLHCLIAKWVDQHLDENEKLHKLKHSSSIILLNQLPFREFIQLYLIKKERKEKRSIVLLTPTPITAKQQKKEIKWMIKHKSVKIFIEIEHSAIA